MIIPPSYAPAPAKLKPGQFAIPKLKWTIAPVGLALANLGPFRAMFTTVGTRGFSHVTEAYLPLVKSSAHLVAADINFLESGILADINAAIKGWRSTHPIFPNDAELIKIAVGIQLCESLSIPANEFFSRWKFTRFRHGSGILHTEIGFLLKQKRLKCHISLFTGRGSVTKLPVMSGGNWSIGW